MWVLQLWFVRLFCLLGVFWNLIFVKFHFFFCLKGRQGKIVSDLLFPDCSSNVHNSWSQFRLRPGCTTQSRIERLMAAWPILISGCSWTETGLEELELPARQSEKGCEILSSILTTVSNAYLSIWILEFFKNLLLMKIKILIGTVLIFRSIWIVLTF